MKVYLVDGTYELFRHFYGVPEETNVDGQEIGATRGVIRSLLGMLEHGATHVAVATDHVIESFRNNLWPGYKDGSGIEPDLKSQFGVLEQAIAALGVALWPMIEFEADDALAAGAAMAADDHRVDQVLICTPDKDLAQCVVDSHVVQYDRRQRLVLDRDGVIDKFGVAPESIPDYLALVGDSADGFPGLKGWGKKSAATVLRRYEHLESIPISFAEWSVEVRGAERLATALDSNRELAYLFRRIATTDISAPVSSSVDEVEWVGPTAEFERIADVLQAPDLVGRAEDAAA